MTHAETPIKILIAEDETPLRDVLQDYLVGRGHKVTVSADGREALRALRSQPFDVALLDIVMPELDGLDVLRLVREDPTPPECIITTGNGTIDTAIAAMRLGAYDYVSKPYRMAELDVLVRRAFEKRQLASNQRRLVTRLSHLDRLHEMTTVYAPLQAVLAAARRAAAGDQPVLIVGETGTGKTALARLLHAHSSRPDGPVLEASCSAMPFGRAEVELFGVERGAAELSAPPTSGCVELAAGGTLILEDIGQLELAAQPLLTEALVQRTFRRVGSRVRIEMEARVVATSRRELAHAIVGGSLRTDLVAALAHVTLRLPPLRDRLVDVPLLAREFVAELGGARGPTIADEAISALQRYSWPGNLSELRNVLERAVLLAGGGIIHAHDLPLPPDVLQATTADDAPLALAEVERRHILAVLQRAGWHQGRAAQLLGLSVKTLYRKIREYGFERPHSGTSA